MIYYSYRLLGLIAFFAISCASSSDRQATVPAPKTGPLLEASNKTECIPSEASACPTAKGSLNKDSPKGDTQAGAQTEPPASNPLLTPKRSEKKQIMIQASNHSLLDSQAKSLPLFVYAFATDPALGIGQYSPPNCNGTLPAATVPQGGQGIERLLQPLDAVKGNQVAKMLIFSSAATAKFHLKNQAFVADLKQRGISWLGYNMEGDKTPQDEICSIRGREDTADNAVNHFASAARSAGFHFMWGPIRNDLDKVSDAVIKGICAAGVSGIAMQEQNTIQAGVESRIQAVRKTIGRYRSLCSLDLHASVQIMSRSCGSDHCRGFVSGVIKEIDSIAIWATGAERQQLNSLIQGLASLMGK